MISKLGIKSVKQAILAASLLLSLQRSREAQPSGGVGSTVFVDEAVMTVLAYRCGKVAFV